MKSSDKGPHRREKNLFSKLAYPLMRNLSTCGITTNRGRNPEIAVCAEITLDSARVPYAQDYFPEYFWGMARITLLRRNLER